MKTVLVFPCGSEIGLEIYRSIGLSAHFRVIGGSSADDHGEFIYKKYIKNLPFVEDEDFISRLNKIVKKYNIDYIFPAHDSVVLKLAKAKKDNVLSCEVITSPYETCMIARSKLKTYKELGSLVQVPKLYARDKIKSVNLPLFLKPDIGQGSKGAYRADSIEHIEYNTYKNNNILILEFLPGKEYTVDCFTDFKGNLLFSEGRERKRVSNGISVRSVISNDKRFKQIANKINKKLKFNGVWFFQVKENVNGELVLLEIAPRVAGTMGLARSRGVNLPLLSLYNAQNINVEIIKNNTSLIIDRALENRYLNKIKYSHVYIDLDDTIIIKDKININIISFLYQCVNKYIKIHLITRHKQNINYTLKKYKLVNLFDHVEVIGDNISKASKIKSKDSIFIDDSFVERKEVYEKVGIPVFDPHSIEALLEK